MEPTPAERSRFVARMLESNDYSAIDDDAVVDVLADILHFCTHHKIDFENCLRLGRMHFSDESSIEQPVNAQP